MQFPTVLRIYLAAYLADAVADTGEPSLHARFLGWIPPRYGR